MKAHIYTRDQHVISRKQINPNALKVLYRLHEAGFRACLVGGGVRDLLLGIKPKDFDVATDAHPEQIRQLFKNCRLIGRRFRLAHVLFGRDIIEVATFRAMAGHDEETDNDQLQNDTGRLLRDNVYGTIEDDVIRRDFTVNALYYDISDFSVIDYCNGMQDIGNRTLRLIGEPIQRYREDPVRMLRALRFAAKLNFTLSPTVAEPIRDLGYLLHDIPAARLFDEVIKLFMSGQGEMTLALLREYRLFGHLFPATERALLEQQLTSSSSHLLIEALKNTDNRLQQDKSVTPFFLYAALLWEPFKQEYQDWLADGLLPAQAAIEAATSVIARQQQHTTIPKRYALPIRELWLMQPRLLRCDERTSIRLMGHPRFRAAFDFLELRARIGESTDIIHAVKWWQQQQLKHPTDVVSRPSLPRRSAKPFS